MLFVGPFELAMQMPSWDRFLQQFSATSCNPAWKFFGLAFFLCGYKASSPPCPAPPRFLLMHAHTPGPINTWENLPLHFCYPQVYWWLHVFLPSPVCPLIVKSRWNFYQITEHVYESRCLFTQQTPEERTVGYGVQSLPFAYNMQLAFQMISLSQPIDVDFGSIVSDRPYIMVNVSAERL